MSGRSPVACDECLARAWLVGGMSERIEGALGGRGVAGARELLALDDERLARALGCDGTTSDAAGSRRRRGALSASGCWATCPHGDGLPTALEDLGDAPAALFGVGDPTALELGRGGALERRVTIVGARRASAYGREVAFALGRDLAAAGATVVSGMAIGIDSQAHRGALSAGGSTIAVLGSGADLATPPRMAGLHREIAQSGAVVSELPPGTPARRWTFPARNRIMAALSALTVVAEARVRSGSLITATMAADLGREVGAVPGRVSEPCASGSNELLRDGAQVIRDAHDALDSLGPGRSVPPVSPVAAPDLDPSLAVLLDLVEREPGGIDALAQASGRAPGEIAAGLARLELLGLIGTDGSGRYAAAAQRRG